MKGWKATLEGGGDSPCFMALTATEVETQVSDSGTEFVIYSGSWCPFCTAALQFLSARGHTVTEIDIDATVGLRRAVVSATGHRTIPVIFDTREDAPVFVGGFDDLRRWM